MQIDRSGVTRLVIVLDRYVIKVPRFLYGWRATLNGLLGNMQEAEWGRTGWPEFCPVTWRIPGGFLIVMRRARVMSEAEFGQFDAEAFCRPGDYLVPAEHKHDSFGYLDGRVVAIDYGS